MRIAGVSTVERAYQLAKSGKARNVSDIHQLLKLEGFSDAQVQLSSRTLTNDLRKTIKTTQPAPEGIGKA